MRSGNILKEHDNKLISILKHCHKAQGSYLLKIYSDDLLSFGLTEIQFVKALERAEKTKLLTLVEGFPLEDATPKESQQGLALVAKVSYYPKGRRRQKGPIKISNDQIFSKGGFAVCKDELGDVGIFYKRKRLYIGPKPDTLLTFLMEHNGKEFTKNELANGVFDTEKVSNISELIRRINTTVATKTKQNMTQIIKKPTKTTFMTDL